MFTVITKSNHIIYEEVKVSLRIILVSYKNALLIINLLINFNLLSININIE